jgi:catechol 2,3-dioxygenase-like lactoylglutathione lyase family enzyme
MRLGHVAFLVRELDEMVAFYVETVGLKVSDIGTAGGRPGTPRAAFLSWDPPTLHHQLALLEVGRDPGEPVNVNHVAFEVDTLDELRTIWNRVSADNRAGSLDPTAGGPVTAFMGDQWSVRFTDPEENGIEIYAPTPWDTRAAAQPYSATRFFEPFDLDADDDALATWGARHLTAMEIDHWPRGERPWPATVEPRSNK